MGVYDLTIINPDYRKPIALKSNIIKFKLEVKINTKQIIQMHTFIQLSPINYLK